MLASWCATAKRKTISTKTSSASTFTVKAEERTRKPTRSPCKFPTAPTTTPSQPALQNTSISFRPPLVGEPFSASHLLNLFYPFHSSPPPLRLLLTVLCVNSLSPPAPPPQPLDKPLQSIDDDITAF